MLKLRLLRIFRQRFGGKKGNQLDFGDFRQIILYFALFIWAHIEYRIKMRTVTLLF